MEGYFKVNDIIEFAGNSYRILYMRDSFGIIIELGTKKMNILPFNIVEYEQALDERIIFLKEEKKDNIRYIHPEQLEGRSKEIYDQYVNTANACAAWSVSLEWLLNCKERAAFLKERMHENGISENTARTRLREFLQNGMSLRGLEARYYNCGGKGKTRVYQNGARPGRKGVSTVVLDDNIIRIFEKMLKRYKAHKLARSVASCYVEMVKDYFADKQVVNGEAEYVLYPVSSIPSKRQFYYYVNKNMSSADKYEAKHGYKKTLNNIRQLHSDTIYSLDETTIGYFEMDEVETDYELVDSDTRNQVIGGAVMYMIIDILSKQIVGYSVGIDNNSWAGAEMALLNMAEDKVKYCAERGISIQPEEWPASGILPKNITCDNGSEYISNQYEQYARDNGFGISFTTSAMGSYKGNIETEFRQFNLKMGGILPGQKTKNAYGKQHEKTARLTIEEFEQIAMRFILWHNKRPMENYKANKEIYEAGITQSPNNIWNYYVKKNHASIKRVSDMDLYRLSLLCSDQATITREGILFKKMIYTCEDREWLRYECQKAALDGRKKLDIKYDKRCMDIIYYTTDGQIYKKAMLNMEKTVNEKYQHKSYASIEEINKEISKSKIDNEMEGLLRDVELQAVVQGIVKEAKKKHKGTNNNERKSEVRRETKEQLHQSRNVVNDIGKEIEQRKNIRPCQQAATALSFEEQIRLEKEAIYLERLSKIKGLQVEVT